jgi:hypothetical protein
MLYPPKFVIYLVLKSYLSPKELAKFNSEIVQKGKSFLRLIKENFDIERLKDAPVVWQDIWIYNYLTYEVGKRTTILKKTPLIKKYEREILLAKGKNYYDEELITLIQLGLPKEDFGIEPKRN